MHLSRPAIRSLLVTPAIPAVIHPVHTKAGIHQTDIPLLVPVHTPEQIRQANLLEIIRQVGRECRRLMK
ncbi:MAG: hypothetical protein GX115_17380 [Ruminiclostridium sp.]|nr:hypothetical protein [Ruminiclostridium sp.]